MPNADCLICGGSQVGSVFQGIDRLHHVRGTFDVVQCAHCGSFSRLPHLSPAALQMYYPVDAYKAYVPRESFLSRAVGRLAWGRKRRFITRLRRVGKVLDIGCATGGFLDEMRRAQWETTGLEPNVHAAAIARGKGHRVMDTTLEEAAFPAESFDVVTMWHVLEHIERPFEHLLEVRRILHPEGFLVLCVPNPESWEASLFRSYWAGFDVPRHAYVFSREGLAALFRRADFRSTEARSFFGGFSSFNFSLGFLLDEICANATVRVAITRTARSIWMGCLLSPLFRIIDLLGRGSVIVYVLAKGDASS
jgi:2-polyprenyl-3-methyl-5-hydroxy-6-metoxy-1,4-benzoquinol methylase